MKKVNSVPKTVDEYLTALPPKVKSTLQSLRKVILSTVPDAIELISYQIPGYKYKGRPLVFFAAFKNHCSFFGTSKSLLERFKKELQPYEISGTTIHFSPENPLPSSLVKKLVKARIEEYEIKQKMRVQ
ncbi:MAG: DUF1801 domain-containing protein [Chitinophagaceae bacterium]|nr:DUF1801 domain-containing protein [Chitinophagaceae bacterium]